MSNLIHQRMAAELDGDFCVFLIGMRINRWSQLGDWWPVFVAMPRMLKELKAHPETGLLGVEAAFGNPSIIIQYWRSFEALERYAKDAQMEHRPAWMTFNQRIAKTRSVGIWHETYQVRAGEYEAIYHHMPPFGLGKAGRLVRATGRRETAAGRLAATPTEAGAA